MLASASSRAADPQKRGTRTEGTPVGGGGVGAVTTTERHVRGQRGGGCHGEEITGVVWAVRNITAPR